MTVLGDLAQATTPWASASWEASLQHLGAGGARLQTLTRAFRIPGSVLALANRLLGDIAPGLPPAVAVRDAPDALAVVRTAPDALAAEVAVRVAAGLEWPGSIGVIVPEGRLDAVAGALADRRIAWGPVEGMASGQRVTLLHAGEVKGLEFDAVVLVEPATIAGTGDPARLRLLYIALTRAVPRLVVVHSEELPRQLAG